MWIFDGLANISNSSNSPTVPRDSFRGPKDDGFFQLPASRYSFSPTSQKSFSERYYQESDPRYWMKAESVRSTIPQNRLLSSTHVEYTTALPPHHPLSISFIDFLFPNLLLLIITWCFCSLHWLLRFPSVSNIFPEAYCSRAYYVSETVIKLLALLWTLMLIRVGISTIFILYICVVKLWLVYLRAYFKQRNICDKFST